MVKLSFMLPSLENILVSQIDFYYKIFFSRFYLEDGEKINQCQHFNSFFKRCSSDLSFQIIHLYEELVYYVDHRGTSPLHLLASKPTAFRSGCHLGGYKKIIYNCKASFILIMYFIFSALIIPKRKNIFFMVVQTCVG